MSRRCEHSGLIFFKKCNFFLLKTRTFVFLLALKNPKIDAFGTFFFETKIDFLALNYQNVKKMFWSFANWEI